VRNATSLYKWVPRRSAYIVIGKHGVLHRNAARATTTAHRQQMHLVRFGLVVAERN